MPVFPVKSLPDGDGFFSIDPEQRLHLSKVRRLKAGDSFKVSLPNGSHATAVLTAEDATIGKIISIDTISASPPLPLWLGIGIIRTQHLEWFISKATELGVQRISLLYLKNSRISPKNPLSLHKLARLNKIADETLKQCEQINPPSIDEPILLNDWLKLCKSETGPKLIFQERSEKPRIENKHFDAKQKHIFLFGPEGGFTAEEKISCQQHHFTSVSLGQKILKTETAAIYSICILDAFLKN